MPSPTSHKPSRPYSPAQLDAPTLLTLLTAANKPLRLDAILRVARVTRNEKAWVENLLQKLVHNGQLVRMHGGAWLPASMVHTVVGRYAVQRSGVGFVTPIKGADATSAAAEAGQGKGQAVRAARAPSRLAQDIFIHPAQAGEAWHGDLVKVAVTPAQGKSVGKSPEGRIIEVLERAQNSVVVRVLYAIGTKASSKMVLCKAADPRLVVQFQVDPSALDHAPRAGELLAVTPQKRLASDLWSAVASSSFGCEDDVAVQERLVKLNHRVPAEFPPKALEEAAALGAEPTEDDMAQREDLRHLPFVTIDGSTARDFDDAICVERQQNGKGWLLRVAIADVTHYMRPASALDKEAQERANSWYFPTSVEPMLPEALSNGLCSLNPHVNRLVMFAEIAIAANGEAGLCRFGAGVIRSCARLTYEEVQAAVVDTTTAARATLLEQAGADEQAGACLNMLEEAVALTHSLIHMRDARGSLDFELPEPEYIFDDQGVIVNIERRKRLFAHRMIEECMIAANEAVARFLESKGTPFLYRVHPEPDVDRLAGLFRTLASTSLAAAIPPQPDAQHLQAMIQQAKGGPQEFLVGRLCLRTMPQARYQPDNEGHFGLASKSYCHFTSPIRRYADVVVHRALKHALGLSSGPIPSEHTLLMLADNLNRRERAAMEAEREMARRLGVLVLRDRVGESFSGTIAGVSDFGLFIELDTMPVEGMVRVADLGDDYYEYDPERQELIGLHTGMRFMLGQRVLTRLREVNVGRLEITLALLEGPDGWKAGKPAAGGKRPPAGRDGRGREAAGGAKKPASRFGGGFRGNGGKGGGKEGGKGAPKGKGSRGGAGRGPTGGKKAGAAGGRGKSRSAGR